MTITGSGETAVLDILVENLGRLNYGSDTVLNSQRKGFIDGGEILLNGEAINRWELRPLPFKSKWIKE
jgi:hypothetical protein